MNIAYICDRKKSCNTSSSCGKECVRTCDISHSVNFSEPPNIEDLRLYFDVNGSGTNETWFEKCRTVSGEDVINLSISIPKSIYQRFMDNGYYRSDVMAVHSAIINGKIEKSTSPIIEGGL